MLEWADTGRGFAAGEGGGRIEVRAPDPAREVVPATLPVAVDDAVAVRCRSATLAGGAPALVALDGEACSLTGGARVGDRAFLLRLDARNHALARFEGPATVTPRDGGARVVFDRPSRLTVGACAASTEPMPAVTVPPTAAGVATAVTHAAAAARTTAPTRSLPGFRRHPPPFELGDRHVPEAVAAATPDTGIEMAVSADLRSVFVAAPLAYYLGATLTTAEEGPPRLRAPRAGLDRTLAPLPEVSSAMLRRVFALDCLVRAASRPGLAESALLDRLDLDADRLRAAGPGQRIARYLAAPFEVVSDDLPEWPLATYVDPTVERIPSLPYLLDALSLVYPPETEDLAGRELIASSLDEFYRGEAPTVDVEKPVLRRGRLHGWLAPGTPIDVFNAHPRAYENRLSYGDRGEDPIRITVVLNDEAMDGEDRAVAAAYRTRNLPVEVDVRRHLTRRQLASVFEARTELVHYIGHCETGGLRCPDGNLAIDALDESNAETFFLNACGSYHEGRALVREGSVAGAVTLREVLDEQAATVGATFARLLVHGFCIERALRLARRRIMMGKDYAVVGVGTHALAGTAADVPRLIRTRPVEDGFEVTCEGFDADRPGGSFETPPGFGERRRLRGASVSARLDRDDLRELLDGLSAPVVHEDGFCWSQEYARRL